MYEVSFWYDMQCLEAFADTAVLDWLRWLYQLALPIGSAHWPCQLALLWAVPIGCTALHVIVDSEQLQEGAHHMLVLCAVLS